MLTKLDWYIIKKFLSTFFFALGLISMVAIVIDLSEKIDDFIQNNASTRQIVLDYYIYFIPWFYSLFNNLFVFISVIFFTSKLASNSEIVAVLASGISYQRLMRPYFISAIFLAVLGYGLNSWLIPYCNSQKVAFENQFINGRRNSENNAEKNVHRQLVPGVYMFIDHFSKQDSLGYKFTLEKFEGKNLSYKLSADKLNWNSETESWQVFNYVERELGKKESVKRGDRKDIDIHFDPHEFFLRKDDVGIFNTAELNRVIEAEQMRGAEKIEYYLVEKYRRLAMPISTIILSIIGLAVSSRKVRGGLGLHMGIGLGLAFSFIFLNQMTYTFAFSGEISPLLAVWIPNILYSGIAYYLVLKTPK